MAKEELKMKKRFICLVCLVLLVCAGCEAPLDEPVASAESASSAVVSVASASMRPEATITDTAAAFSALPSAVISSTPEPETTPIGMSDHPVNTATMYSSYAFMVSFDPARGWADFDYFDMLRGDDAVQWLVDQEGYDLAAAQAEVADYADSEFICKNTNPTLRTIDLRTIPIQLMYHPDGTMVDDATPIDSDIEDVFDLYMVDPGLLLDSFFYYIEVDDANEVVSVQQVYWP